MSSPSMTRIYSQLVRATSNQADEPDPEKVKNIYEEYYSIARRKLSRAKKRGFMWADACVLVRPEHAPTDSSLIDLLTGFGIDRLHGPEHHITYHNSKQAIIGWHLDKSILGVRLTDRVIMNNPVTGIQSWYHPRIDPTTKHEYHSRIPNASVFVQGLDKAVVEQEAFVQGVFTLDARAPQRRAYILARFDQPVGLVNGKETSFVKIQADRERAHRGYHTRIHGYPISHRELIQNYDRPVLELIDTNRISLTGQPHATFKTNT
jgi:hypothetical protein